MEWFATCPRALEPLVADELTALGARDVTVARSGVAFAGALEDGYRAVLGSRVANRILLPLLRFEAQDPDALYAGVRRVRWREHLTSKETLAVDFTQIGSPITHTQFGALKVKDAIVDQLREETGARPSVDRIAPDVRVNVHLDGTQATVSIDLAGESLHRRGWRSPGAEAPLKENLAAAILLFAGWPKHAADGAPLIDPMCGSGTLLVEAALIATDRAPGLLRATSGPGGWLGHDHAKFRAIVEEARGRVKPLENEIRGFDADARAVRLACENVRRAGFEAAITVEKADLSTLAPIGDRPGLVVTNPPYGERLGDEQTLVPLYEQLGDVLKRRFPGWTGWVLTGNLTLGKRLGLRPKQRIQVWNGPIECRLYELPISTEAPRDEEGPVWRKPRPPSPAAEMFKNRLAKNLKHLRKWAKREDVHCFRVYDADLPEYAVAVDLYEDAVHVQEYDAPKTVDPRAAEQRLHDVMAMVPEVLGVDPRAVHLKVRRRQRGLQQYEKHDDAHAETIVREGGHRFVVNLSDYIDTGLFLDHRTLRREIESMARGKRFLNLFAYTCTATVYAVKGGARSSLSVDLSNTYLDWGARNFELNQVDQRLHRLERADVLDWIGRARGPWDLVFCAPPTFSRSKSMSGTFDVQRDHVALIHSIAKLLSPGGTLLFSSNLRKFKMDAAALQPLTVEDWSRRTLPEDFRRNPRIHTTWRITRG
jgi:23S rRNA (guanine2445-N2)-methyltransferase / 23S rRNA (guanine2069-N7)-methyltransferase